MGQMGANYSRQIRKPRLTAACYNLHFQALGALPVDALPRGMRICLSDPRPAARFIHSEQKRPQKKE